MICTTTLALQAQSHGSSRPNSPSLACRTGWPRTHPLRAHVGDVPGLHAAVGVQHTAMGTGTGRTHTDVLKCRGPMHFLNRG